MKYFYLGAFPPGYGGVTIKNRDLYQGLSQRLPMERVDFNRIKRRGWREALRLAGALLGQRHTFVIGVAGKQTRKRFSGLLYHINRRAMNRSLLVVMGGTAARDIAADPQYRKWVAQYKKIYVETEGMRSTLAEAGLTNAALYPNGRFIPKQTLPCRENTDRPLRCLCFSQVSREKGADIALDAVKALPQVELDLYGHVVPEYEADFRAALSACPNAVYQGIFKGEPEELYRLLNQYDLLLFPTRWKHEGVPGVLVEAKIAALPAVVSDVCYNAELVRDGEGVVLPENDAAHMAQAIRALDADRARLFGLKQGAQRSAERFFIEYYMDELVGALTEQGGNGR